MTFRCPCFRHVASFREPASAGWSRRGSWAGPDATCAQVDVFHIHAARDLITLPLARYALSRGKPYVLQPHGMIDPSHRALSRPLDALATRRVLQGAAAVFYLTPWSDAGLVEVARDPLHQLTELDERRPQGRPREVTPAPSAGAVPGAAPGAEAALDVRVHGRAALGEGVDAAFHLVGPDEGEGPRVRAAISALGSERLAWEGPIAPESTLRRLSQAALFVLPAVNEPYPMAVLEALSVGCPVVVTESCGLAPAIERPGVRGRRRREPRESRPGRTRPSR